MSMETQVKEIARIAAIEYLLQKLFAAVTQTMTDEQMALLLQNYRDGFDCQSIPGADAAMSDLVTAEVRDEVLRLLNGEIEIRKSGR